MREGKGPEVALSKRQRQCLDIMGIPVWSLRTPPAPRAAGISRAGTVSDPRPALPAEGGPDGEAGAVSTLGWEALEARVAACTLCELHRTRTRTVFGVGNRSAEWMIIGEAPGADEDRQGEPFVGRAGQLLNEMLLAVGLKREAVYIANILKCRPPSNRDPRPEEVASCEPYLQRQVSLVAPRLILAVGRVAAQNLLKTDTPIGAMRGRQYHYGEARIPVVVTYHPAYLLRSPREKRKAWEDLKFAMQVYEARQKACRKACRETQGEGT